MCARLDPLVLVVEDRRLDRALEELVRVAAEELVEGVVAGDVERDPLAAPPGAAPHLPQAGDRAREGDADRGVELADVDPELERVGGDHREQLAGGEPRLDLAALLRRVAGAVGRDPLGEVRPGRGPRGASARSAGSARPRGGCAGSRSSAGRRRRGRRPAPPPPRAPSGGSSSSGRSPAGSRSRSAARPGARRRSRPAGTARRRAARRARPGSRSSPRRA